MKLVQMTVLLWVSAVLSAMRKAWAKDDLDPPSGERETLPSPETAARERLTRERSDTLPSATWKVGPGIVNAKSRDKWEVN